MFTGRFIMARRKPFNLKQFVLREAASLSGEVTPIEKVDPVEYEAGEEAKQLELDIDFIKALKIKEAKINRMHKKLVREMRKVQMRKKALKRRVTKNI